MSKALLWVGAVAVALLVAWWVTSSIGPSDSEEIAVHKAEAKRNADLVVSLTKERDEARAEADRIDTIIKVVLARPQPVRPPVHLPPVLDTVARDTLIRYLRLSEAYADSLEIERLVLQETLDTAQQAFQRYRLVADSTINVQAREIDALWKVADLQECRIARLLKCPSRKWSALGGAVLAIGVISYVQR